MKKILGCIRRADQDFGMFAAGDRVCVGLSGGKDSMVLLEALSLYRRFSKMPYTLQAVTVSLGMQPFDTAPIAARCAELGVPYTVVDTEIGDVVFNIRKEKNPCALCAKMRRGALYNAARRLGCNKVALGHHREDALETFFLCLFYESRLATFSPVTYLSRTDLTMIRPMIYAPEKHIISVARALSVPVVPSPCPANGNTQRQEIKEWMKTLHRFQPNMEERMLTALRTPERYNLWDRRVGREED